MTEKKPNKKPVETVKFKLTPEVVTNQDLSRAIHEVEKLDEFLYQAHLRKAASRDSLPKTTVTLEKLAEANNLSLTNAEDRKQLINHLRELKMRGKKLHISFAVEPSPAVVQKIVLWMRQNIHQEILVDIGIQPAISVGCVVRTTNKVFDMSLRHRFDDSRTMLSGLLEKSS